MHKLTSSLLYPIAVLSLLLASCAGDSVEPEVPEVHEEATGFALLVDSIEVMRHLSGEPSDTLFLRKDSSSPLYTVRFVDTTGKIFTPGKLDTGNTVNNLSLDISDETVIIVDRQSKWIFSLRGEEVGEASLEVLIRHHDFGDHFGGHIDFRSDPLIVVVRP